MAGTQFCAGTKYLLGARHFAVIRNSFRQNRSVFSDFKIDMIEFMAMRSKWSRRRSTWRLKKSHIMGADRKWEVDCLRREIRQAARVSPSNFNYPQWSWGGTKETPHRYASD